MLEEEGFLAVVNGLLVFAWSVVLNEVVFTAGSPSVVNKLRVFSVVTGVSLVWSDERLELAWIIVVKVIAVDIFVVRFVVVEAVVVGFVVVELVVVGRVVIEPVVVGSVVVGLVFVGLVIVKAADEEVELTMGVVVTSGIAVESKSNLKLYFGLRL